MARSAFAAYRHLEIPRLPVTGEEAVHIAKLVPGDASFEVDGGMLSLYRYLDRSAA